jgi:hypothetical protein
MCDSGLRAIRDEMGVSGWAGQESQIMARPKLRIVVFPEPTQAFRLMDIQAENSPRYMNPPYRGEVVVTDHQRVRKHYRVSEDQDAAFRQWLSTPYDVLEGAYPNYELKRRKG